jgi:hypothetical protein
VKVYDIPFEIESAFAIYEALVTDAAGEVTPEVEEAERNLKALLEQGAQTRSSQPPASFATWSRKPLHSRLRLPG